MTKSEILKLLNTEDDKALEKLYRQAYAVKLSNVGNKVYLRGIIEFSNICEKNCFYCGIRKDNSLTDRFLMPEEEILRIADLACRMGYGSIVLQSGERQDEEFVRFVDEVIKKIKLFSNGSLGITLSVGEQTYETFQRWFNSGAHRYLLRIETSNPRLYKTLHPLDHEFDRRLDCLGFLRDIGYQVGTGIMIGLPGQTYEDLMNDIFFLKQNDIDMIGMGPYIMHKDTPLAVYAADFDESRNFLLGLKMIALTRIYLEDVNIASTTALQTLSAGGRQLGIKAGANIIMPNITPVRYRSVYQLYEDKPCLDESAGIYRERLNNSIRSLGETIIYNEWGDSPHFYKRKRMLSG